MKLSPDIEEKGLQAYEQVCAFEQLERRQLPLIYGLFSLALAFVGLGMLLLGPLEFRFIGAMVGLVSAGMFALVAWQNWKKLKARYAKNLELLTELEGKYGDQLPWIKVENHFAALEQLKRDLAEEKATDEERLN